MEEILWYLEVFLKTKQQFINCQPNKSNVQLELINIQILGYNSTTLVRPQGSTCKDTNFIFSPRILASR